MDSKKRRLQDENIEQFPRAKMQATNPTLLTTTQRAAGLGDLAIDNDHLGGREIAVGELQRTLGEDANPDTSSSQTDKASGKAQDASGKDTSSGPENLPTVYGGHSKVSPSEVKQYTDQSQPWSAAPSPLSRTNQVLSPVMNSTSATPATSPLIPSLTGVRQGSSTDLAGQGSSNALQATTSMSLVDSGREVLKARPAPHPKPRIMGKNEFSESEDRLILEKQQAALLHLQASSLPPPPIVMPPPVHILQTCGRGCCSNIDCPNAEKPLKAGSLDSSSLSALRKLRSARILGPDHVEPPLLAARGPYAAGSSSAMHSPRSGYTHSARLLPYPPTPAAFNIQMQAVSDAAGQAMRNAVAQAVQQSGQSFFSLAQKWIAQPSDAPSLTEWAGGVPDWNAVVSSPFMQQNWYEKDPATLPKPSWDNPGSDNV